MKKIISKAKSRFFNFKKIKNSRNYNISYYKGWHNLSIFRIEFLKSINEEHFFNKNKINIPKSSEKLLILSRGNAFAKEVNFKKKLKKFDSIHTNRPLTNFELKCKKGSQVNKMRCNKIRRWKKNFINC